MITMIITNSKTTSSSTERLQTQPLLVMLQLRACFGLSCCMCVVGFCGMLCVSFSCLVLSWQQGFMDSCEPCCVKVHVCVL